MRNASNGGLFFFRVGGDDAAVALVNPRRNTLLVLNVLPQCRHSGLGAWIVRWLEVNWIRALEDTVSWFEKLGYRKVGRPKQGRRLRTQIMVREDLLTLSGRLQQLKFDESKR